MTYDSTEETQKHIDRVAFYLRGVVFGLERRAVDHDASKLVDPEKAGWDIATPKLADLEYGSEEYKANLNEIRPIIIHHYKHNSHHPEFYGRVGINGMSLLDLIEMFCDWKAASERGLGNDFMEGLAYNRKRFFIDDQLFSILQNTAKELGFDK
jgi:hypothetical protein